MFQDNLTQIKKEVRRSKEEFIQEHFKQQIQNLLEQYPNVNLHHMGFPRNWQDEPLWK